MASSGQKTETRATLADLRAQLATLEQAYNRAVPRDVTIGRRTRLAHEKILAEIAMVKGAIHQREQELGA